MLLTITTTHEPATDLGYLLHKNPARPQTFELPFGKAHVFYPEATAERCTAALLLDVDPIGLVRGPGAMLTDYVNDRPYVASSLLSVAIARILGSALSGNCKQRPALADTEIPLEATVAAVPCRGREELVNDIFGPLGYTIEASTPAEADASPYRNIRLQKRTRLTELLRHLYVLLPVLDSRKHYWIGEAEVDKLLEKGKGWLEDHPARETIVRRALGGRKAIAAEATARLTVNDQTETDLTDEPGPTPAKYQKLHDQRHDWAIETLKAEGSRTVIDIGCGEGRLLRRLAEVGLFTKLTGADVSTTSLAYAERRLHLRTLPPAQRARLKLFQTGLTYRDKRLAGYDAATVVEVIEHIDTERLPAFEQALFGEAQPTVIVLTTPNREYNAVFEQKTKNGLRHRDHRFEWSREEFAQWARGCAERHGYRVETGGIGPDEPQLGQPTQKAVFKRC